MKRLDLAADNYDDFNLGDEVEVEVCDQKIPCKLHGGQVLNVSITSPLRYLGVGRDKVVVSGLVGGLDSVVESTGLVRVAVGIARQGGNAVKQLRGLSGYSRLRKLVPNAPTYPWYAQSVDQQVVLMPDLTQEGKIVTAQNDRILSPEKLDRLEAAFDDIVAQLQAFVDGLPFGVTVTFDAYFAILGEHSSRLFLGDFDDFAIGHDNLDRSVHNRLQAEKWLEAVANYFGDRRMVSYAFQTWAHQHELPPRGK